MGGQAGSPTQYQDMFTQAMKPVQAPMSGLQDAQYVPKNYAASGSPSMMESIVSMFGGNAIPPMANPAGESMGGGQGGSSASIGGDNGFGLGGIAGDSAIGGGGISGNSDGTVGSIGMGIGGEGGGAGGK
jgi:hypothetical protein